MMSIIRHLWPKRLPPEPELEPLEFDHVFGWHPLADVYAMLNAIVNAQRIISRQQVELSKDALLLAQRVRAASYAVMFIALTNLYWLAAVRGWVP